MLARAERLVGDTDAAARDEPDLVGLARTGGGPPRHRRGDPSAHGRASSTMLKGVSVARRKRVKPAGRDDVAQARLAGLCAQPEPDLLRQRGRGADQRRGAVVDAADRD